MNGKMKKLISGVLAVSIGVSGNGIVSFAEDKPITPYEEVSSKYEVDETKASQEKRTISDELYIMALVIGAFLGVLVPLPLFNYSILAGKTISLLTVAREFGAGALAWFTVFSTGVTGAGFAKMTVEKIFKR